MLPPPNHGFPRLVRKKADWGDWVVSPVWIVMESAVKRTLNRALAVPPNGRCVPAWSWKKRRHSPKSRLSRKQRRRRVSFCGKASDFRYDAKLISSRTYRRGLLQIWLVPGE